MADDEKRHLTFYGASDDLIEVEGDVPGCDEYPGEDSTFLVAGIAVRVFYGPGVWAITVVQIDEDVPVLAENITLAAQGYSMRLDLDVPAGSYVAKRDSSDA